MSTRAQLYFTVVWVLWRFQHNAEAKLTLDNVDDNMRPHGDKMITYRH